MLRNSDLTISLSNFLKKNQIIPDNKLYAGCPAVEKGDIEQRHQEIMQLGKQMYVELCSQYMNTLKRIDPS